MFRRAVVLIISMMLTAPASATEAGWALLRNGGQIVLLANANAPGSGDPANFDIENCRTQRNLSDRGRQQARRIGALFAARAEPVSQVYSSLYCRALETARLAFGERLVETLPALNSITATPDLADQANNDVLQLIREYSDSGNLVLVTHPENITALTDIKPREGEAIIVAPMAESLSVIGRIVFN